MAKNKMSHILFVMGLLFLLSAFDANAEIKTFKVIGSNVTETAENDSVSAIPVYNNLAGGMESLFPEKSLNLNNSHFSWGVEVGSSIDATGHDMSTFNIDVMLGYKNAYIKMLGIGAGVHRSVHFGNNFIPVYGVIRTSFRKKPSLFFLDIQAGYSFNTVEHSSIFGDMTSSIGLGINLSQTSRAKSYILLAAGYHYFNEVHKEMVSLDIHHLFVANLAFGISF